MIREQYVFMYRIWINLWLNLNSGITRRWPIGISLQYPETLVFTAWNIFGFSFLLLKMEKDDVEYQILNFLQLQHNNTTETSNIKQAVRVDNRSLNRHLYKLKRDGILIKINERPPTWQLNLKRKQNTPSLRKAQIKQKHYSGRNNNPIYGRKVKINVILYNLRKYECTTKVHMH